METIDKQQFAQFVSDIKTKIREAQYEALRAVNRQLIDLYWSIGQSIIEKQEAFGWGKSVVEKLSVELQAEFRGTTGFSSRNLWNMRDFYRSYAGHEILQPLVAEISWAKNLIILTKCKDNLQREFYIRMTKKYGWTWHHYLQKQKPDGSRIRLENRLTSSGRRFVHDYETIARSVCPFSTLCVGNNRTAQGNGRGCLSPYFHCPQKQPIGIFIHQFRR